MLVSIVKKRLTEDNRFDARLIDRYSFNTIGRNCTLDERVFAQDFEPLGCLLREEFLLATGFAKISQVPRCRGGDVWFRCKQS